MSLDDACIEPPQPPTYRRRVMSPIPSSRIRTAVAILTVLALETLSGTLSSKAQSVVPVQLDHGTGEAETAASTTGDEQRLDAEIFETPTVIGDVDEGGEETIWVPRSIVEGLCGDSDGCTLRMVLIFDESASDSGPVLGDGRFFTIRDSGAWSAHSGGGDHWTSGNIESTPEEVVFQLGSHTCVFRDNNGFVPIPFRRFELVVSGETIVNTPMRCLLRIDD